MPATLYTPPRRLSCSLNLEFYQRGVTHGMRSRQKKFESEVQPGLGFHSSAIEEVDHDALLLTFVIENCQPGIHEPNCSLMDCDGCLERNFSSFGSTQHVYVREKDWEVISRDIIDGLTLLLVPFFCLFFWARRCGEGEEKS